MTRFCAACGLAVLALGGPVAEARAQTETRANPPSSGESGDANAENFVSYPAAFFASSRPNTAFDMIQRTPAFSFNGGKEVRGLAGAAGNVLIDGQPQTSKAVTLQDALTRIPASQVLRIDIVRGGAGGVDMLGFPVVANIVRLTGAISQVDLQIDVKGYVEPVPVDYGVRVEGSRRKGDLLLAGVAELRRGRADDTGRGYLARRDGAGRGLDSGDYVSDATDKTLTADGALEYRTGETLVRGNFGLEVERSDRDDISLLTVPERFVVEDDDAQIEAGGNIERRFSPRLTGRLDLLQNVETQTRTAGRVGRQATTETTGGESILRGALTWRHDEALAVEAGAEGAFNFLDQKSTLTTANANVRVEERRAQPYATVNWQVSPPFALELGLRYETSMISQSGDTNSERSFSFLKPRAIAAIDIGSGLQVRLRFERDVKQLDFGDFAASTGNTDSSASAGNAELQPERAWVYEAAIEQRLWERSALVFTYMHEQVEEVLDYSPVGLAGDGHGNIGDGTRDTYTLDMKVALDRLGLKGGRLEVLPIYYGSNAIDPFTHAKRWISGSQQWRGKINLYLDRPEIQSTFGLESMIGYRERIYRFDQVQTTMQGFFYTLWGEWKPRPSTAIRASFFQLGPRQRFRTREVYLGRRGGAPLSFVEGRMATRDVSLQIKLRQTF